MKKATITFDVYEDKTNVISTGIYGQADTMDITGTDAEKLLIKLIKKIREDQLAKEVLAALDINTWERVQ